jgi:hypothetical protein
MSFPFYQVFIRSKRIAEWKGNACADDHSVRYHTETMAVAKKAQAGLLGCHQGLTASTQNPFSVSTTCASTKPAAIIIPGTASFDWPE